jgi:glucose-1-phosphate thymidylyltransferase
LLPSSNLKIVILMAGYGTRLRPLTWNRPKQLIRLADKMVLDFVLSTYTSIPETINSEFIFVVGYLGDQIQDYMRRAHPGLKVRFVEQSEMHGQSHAVLLAKEYLDSPMLVMYADTLIETDFAFLSTESSDAVAWVKAVPDPRRFGVATLDHAGWVTHLVEKPQGMDNNLALVGCYYFQNPNLLLQAIEEQMTRNISLKNEFYLADAINVMLEHGLKMRIERVETWLDAGTPDDVLKTNRYFLEHGHNNSPEDYTHKNIVFIPPVFIHPTASVESSVIGPHVAIGANCSVQSCIIRDTIIDDGCIISNVLLEHSLIGREVKIKDRAGTYLLGDNTELTL